jgi:integrase
MSVRWVYVIIRRDRAILSVGLQVGLRRAEIAALKDGDLHQNRGYDSLLVMRKGGRRDALAINPQTAAHNGKRDEDRRHMDPDAIDRVVRKYALALGKRCATGECAKAAGRRDPSTTKLYYRRGFNPESGTVFCNILKTVFQLL